jgi:hypothetical protein
MAAPLLGFVALVVGIGAFVAGLVLLPSCVGTSLVLFGVGIAFIGAGAAFFGGVLVAFPAGVLSAVLIIVGLLTGFGVSECVL